MGIFDSAPGTQAYGNVVINNQLKDNGLPGLAMHSPAPGQNLNEGLHKEAAMRPNKMALHSAEFPFLIPALAVP